MFDFNTLINHDRPFVHMVGKAVSDETVREINSVWPMEKGPDWYCEKGKFARKDALMFPRRLPAPAQALAEHMYSPEVCERLSYLTGIDLQPDPWFLEGPLKPALGGGLHEIHPGGLLKMHIDFNRHPAGLVRCLNLLIYLNLEWQPAWGGALELLNDKDHFRSDERGHTSRKLIQPTGGMVVIFETTPESWHGHPHPLACPEGKTRRSMALYYYTSGAKADRDTTVYKR